MPCQLSSNTLETPHNKLIDIKITGFFCCCFRRQQRLPGGGGGAPLKSQNPLQQQQGLQQQQQQPNQMQQPNADHQSGAGTKYGGRGYQGQQNQGGWQGGPHHGYSQNRRWHQHPKHQTNSVNQGPSGADRGLTRNTKESEIVKHGEPEPHMEKGAKDEPAKEERKKGDKEEKMERGKICLLQSSKERLRRRLKEKVIVAKYISDLLSVW